MAAGSIWVSMEVGADGVALITFSNPPVNALHPIIIAGLKDAYAEAMRRDDVKAILLTGTGVALVGIFLYSQFKKFKPKTKAS